MLIKYGGRYMIWEFFSGVKSVRWMNHRWSGVPMDYENQDRMVPQRLPARVSTYGPGSITAQREIRMLQQDC